MNVGMKVSFEVVASKIYGRLGCASLNLLPDSVLIIEIFLKSSMLLVETIPQTLEEIKIYSTSKKDKGNEEIQSKDYVSAKNFYLEAIHAIKYDGLSMDEIFELEKHLIPIYSNIAFCDLSLLNYSSAIICCKWVLDRDGDNAKANYRAGVVFEDTRQLNEAKLLFTKSYKSSNDKGSYKRLQTVLAKIEKEKKRKKENPWEGIFIDQSKKAFGFN